MSLTNRWAAGENPWCDADWSASWRITKASEPVTTIELNGIVGAIVHLAYHLGAIRQIHHATRGPLESNAP